MSADDSSSTTSGARDTQYRRRKAKPVRLVDAAPRAPPNGTTKRARGGDDQASAQVKRARKPSRSKLASAMDAFVGETRALCADFIRRAKGEAHYEVLKATIQASNDESMRLDGFIAAAQGALPAATLQELLCLLPRVSAAVAWERHHVAAHAERAIGATVVAIATAGFGVRRRPGPRAAGVEAEGEMLPAAERAALARAKLELNATSDLPTTMTTSAAPPRRRRALAR